MSWAMRLRSCDCGAGGTAGTGWAGSAGGGGAAGAGASTTAISVPAATTTGGVSATGSAAGGVGVGSGSGVGSVGRGLGVGSDGIMASVPGYFGGRLRAVRSRTEHGIGRFGGTADPGKRRTALEVSSLRAGSRAVNRPNV